MKNPLNKILKSEFGRNVATLTSGTAIAQLIPFLLAPVLSRIYTPADFGRLALYLAIVQVLGDVSTGRYHLAILLPKKETKALGLTMLSIFIGFFLSVVIGLIVLLYSDVIAEWMGDPLLVKWLFLVPISILMMSIFNSLSYFNTRLKNYGTISVSNVFKSTGGALTQIGLGIISKGGGGLIIGQVSSHLFGNLRLLRSLAGKKEILRTISFREYRALAGRYIKFPKYSLPGIFLNTLSYNVVNVFLSRMFNVGVVGHYSFAFKYIGFPIILIANSIGQVYMQRMSEAVNDLSTRRSLFLSTLKKLTLIGVILFVPIFFVVEELFAFFFGEEWRRAGEIARYLIPLTLIRFVVVPLALSFIVFEKQQKEFVAHLIILLLTLVVFIISSSLNLTVMNTIILYSVSLTFGYLFILYLLSRMINN